MPGAVYTGKVESRVCRRSRPARPRPRACRGAEGSSLPRRSSCASSSTTPALANRLPAGATGTAAIFTERVKARARHPQGAAAAGRDPELRQSVLRQRRALGRQPCHGRHLSERHAAKNDGNDHLQARVKDVPVDGFWSVSLYTPTATTRRTRTTPIRSTTSPRRKNADGSIAIQFGGCDGKIRTACRS